MSLRDFYSNDYIVKNGNINNKTIISFEIFPPKNDEDGQKLEKVLAHMTRLKKYNPAFVSLTYGAGGTTQNSSLNILERLQNDLGYSVMPHFTCVGSSKEFVKNYLSQVNSMGIRNILALRGDIPQGMEQNNFDFRYANELVEFINSETDLSIGVAGYPEGHLECDDFELDIENLRRKVNSGADAIFTQMFFDNQKFFDFCDKLSSKGVDVPVIPGILPIKSYSQLERMLSMAKVVIPSSLMQKLEKYKDYPEDIKKIGVDFATEQCQELIDSQVKGLHFYTLNTASPVSLILDNLGF